MDLEVKDDVGAGGGVVQLVGRDNLVLDSLRVEVYRIGCRGELIHAQVLNHELFLLVHSHFEFGSGRRAKPLITPF